METFGNSSIVLFTVNLGMSIQKVLNEQNNHNHNPNKSCSYQTSALVFLTSLKSFEFDASVDAGADATGADCAFETNILCNT